MKPHLLTILLAAGFFAVAICSIASAASDAATDDMTSYRTMAKDILTAFKAGDMETAKAKSKEIQKVWDHGQKDLKSRSPEKWKAADKAMDGFVKPILRKAKLDPTKVQTAYEDYMAKLDAAATPGETKLVK